MFSLKLSKIFVFIVSLSSSLFTFTSAVNPTYLYHICNEKNFTRNSSYQSNLNRLLTSLPPYTEGGHKFYRISEGVDPNKVYGLFQCRGDVNTTTCVDCVAFASREASQRCPTQKGILIWYDECYLYSSDVSNFYGPQLRPGALMYNTNNVTSEPSRFQELVLDVMKEAATQAANDPNNFATRKRNFTTFGTVYSLVQCSEDLWNTDCSNCLQRAISLLPNGTVGARVLLPACICRFEIYPFYRENLTESPSAAPKPAPPSPPSPVTRLKGKSRISSSTIIAIVAPITVATVLVVAGYCFLKKRAKRKYYNTSYSEEDETGNDILTIEALQFDFGTIQAATNRFSTNNKLGAGGFGEVYKGILPNGQEIAVKRLSKKSGQGVKEFKNEVIVVAKLQHRNLVRLQGFCLEGEEKILVYEFMPNKSLDYFLYDPIKQGQLDWPKRYTIIRGIARGILYLHEDSRLKIIHRDLKASNVLLDEDMNPKISDFGMAKIFGVDQTEGNTSKIMGTYGYMSPEYAMHGQFSVKSDVYSFGVLVLEIITGRKNNSFSQIDRVWNLLSYAWERWRDETPLQLLDSTLIDSYSENEVMRCIHVGLLCVQEDPAVRPTMATVVHMLNSYSVSLPLPQQPAFFLGTRTEVNKQTPKGVDSDQSTSKSIPWSVDNASITELNPR